MVSSHEAVGRTLTVGTPSGSGDTLTNGDLVAHVAAIIMITVAFQHRKLRCPEAGRRNLPLFRTSRSLFAVSLFFCSTCIYGQAGNACDLNQDGVVNSADVQAAVNMALGLAPCTASLTGLNSCNIVVVQRVIVAAAGGNCLTSTGVHVVDLSWTASTSSGVAGYKIYRGTTSGGPYTFLAAVGNVTSYMDTTVLSGQTYYYVATAVDGSGNESGYSAQSRASIPTP